MIGAEFSALKRVKSLLLSVVVAASGISISATAAQVQTATFNINATFTAPACALTAPSSYALGMLTPGNPVRHPPLELKWRCADNVPVRTALKGAVLQGQLNGSQDKLEMISTQTGKKNGTLLWLEMNGSIVKLSGNNADAFCRDASAVTGTRRCLLTPVTEAHTSDTFGPVKAVINFEVIYP